MEEQYELAGVADFHVPPVSNPIHRLNNFPIKQYPIRLLPSRDQYSYFLMTANAPVTVYCVGPIKSTLCKM